MRFWLVLMGVSARDELVALAQHAEACGFHGVTYADHLIMPTDITSSYPYSKDGSFFIPIEEPWPDAWITLSVIGAATTRLHLATNIYLAALRDPFTVARAIATASAFTDGRVVCGVSAGWLKEEYTAAGIDFHTRGKRLDEVIAVCRKLWTGDVVEHHGAFFDFGPVILRPRPAKPVPIWSGGVSPLALRRAATNDGWLGIPMDADQNIETVRRMQAVRKDKGLPEDGFHPCISLAGKPLPDVVARLEEAGIRDMSAMPWIETPWDVARYVPEGADIRQLQVKKDAVSRYAEAVLGRL